MKNLTLLLILLASFSIVGCMPKVEDESRLAAPVVVSGSVQTSASSPYIQLTGSCPTATKQVLISIDGGSYSQALSSLAGAASAGTIVARCQNGVFSSEYYVPNSGTSRSITFNIKVADSKGRTSPIAKYIMNYSALTPNPGFVIAAGGGISVGGAGAYTTHMFTTIGEPTTGGVLSGGQSKLKVGMAGLMGP